MKIYLPSFILCMVLTGCSFNYSSNIKTIDDLENKEALRLSKKALRFIKEGDSDSLMFVLDNRVRQRTTKEQIEILLSKGKKTISTSRFPQDSDITVSQSINISVMGKRVTESLTFPFHNLQHYDSVKYFHITVVDDKILSLFLNDHAF